MRLFFYILREYLKYVIGTIVMTVFLFVLFDFIHKTTKYFAEYNPTTENIVKYYLFQVPGQVVQALPIAGLLASVICMILLSRTNEVTAMRAAGMGPLQIGAPLAAGGLLLSLGSFLLSEVVVPRFAQRVHYVKQVLIEGEKDDQIAEGAKWVRDGQNLINFQDYDPLTQTLANVRLVEVRPNFRPVQAIEADLGSYVRETKTWKLTNLRILYFKRSGILDRVEARDSLDIALPIEPEKLRRDRRQPNELKFFELRELVERGDQSGADTLQYKVDLQGKLAYPFAAFVVSLIGLKFGYRSERSTETAKGVLLAFSIGISYWFVLSAGRALGKVGDVPPFVAAWLPNVVVLGLVAFDAWMSKRT